MGGDDVVGQVQEAADQDLVAFDAFRRELLAVGLAPLGRRALDHEAAFRADRHDDRVLDRLRLHQAEDLGAEILPAVGPADAAARHLAGAHVHALDARAVDVDLVERPRQWEQVDRTRCELDRERRLRLAGGSGLVVIGAHALHDERQVGAQDAVLVEAFDGVERVVDRLDLGHRVE